MQPFSLDIRTLAAVLMMISAVLSVTMVLTLIKRRVYPGFGLWAAGNAAFAVGFLFITLRGRIPELFAVVGSNCLLLVATGLYWEGTRRFLGASSRARTILWLILFAVALLSYFTYVSNDLGARIVIFSLWTGVLFGLVAWELLWHVERERRFSHWLTGGLFAVYGLFMLFRALYTALHPTPPALFAPTRLQTLTFLLPGIFSIAWTFGFVMLNGERLEAELKSAHAELERLAMTDFLTGIPNIRHFLALGGHEIQRARRYGRPVVMLMIDIDHFKQINDTHGHAVGDQALTAIAATCRTLLRDIDLFGRLGGEEFGVLLPETELAGGQVTAERLRAAIAETVFAAGGAALHMTVSIGIAALRDEDEQLDALLKRADHAMYEAKRRGRNQAVAA